MIQLSPEATKILRRTIRSVPNEPDPLLFARTITRSTTIVGLMLEDLGDKRNGWKKPGGILARVGSITWGLVELSAPHSLGEVLFQYWIVLAYALAVLMIVVGILTTAEPVTRAGALVLAVVFSVHVVVEKVRLWMTKHDLQALKPTLMVPVVLLASLAGMLLLSKMKSLTPDTERWLFWDFAFIAVYTVWFLALGWILATFFDRPYRAWIAVVIPALLTASADILENLRALKGPDFPMDWDFTSLKWNAARITFGALALQVLTTWMKFRQWRKTGPA